MKSESNVDAVRAVFEAFGTGNRSALEPLIAQDFHFTSPLDNRIDRKVYFERCWPNSGKLEGFDFIHLVPEILTLRDGQVVEVEVYFGWSIPHQAKPGGFVSG